MISAQINKTTRIVPVAVIANRCYRTAQTAAVAWSEWCAIRRHERHSQILGHAAYHDAAWAARTQNFEQRALRRSLKVFQKYLP